MDGPLPFPRTKLHPPRVHADVLPRPRLHTLIHHALASARLILLSAPAGSGKTTLLVSALAQISVAVAWLRLDADDNDPIRFLHALLAAVERVAPASVVRAATVLAEPSAGPTLDQSGTGRRVLTALLNDLPTGGLPLTLVLDDLHAIVAPEVYALVDHLLEHLPDDVTLLVTTRHDPSLALVRLRVQRALVELRLPDLRFRPDESQLLLNERLHLDLTAGDVAALHTRTEGWAAGLTLLAASLERIASTHERERFLAHLHQTDRYVFDYLAEEVLNRQEPFVRMFLLETAVLPDLTPTRCTALTGRNDAAAILEDLERRNLFLVALDSEQSRAERPKNRSVDTAPNVTLATPGFPITYRYHDLFRTFLLNRLEREHPHWLATLHRRAALSEPDAVRRIAHLLQAQAWDEAASAIIAVAPTFVGQGTHQLLRGWIEALPLAVREAKPWLLYWLATCTVQTFDLVAARGLLEQALKRFTALQDVEGEATVLVRLAVILTQLGDWPAALQAMEQANARPLSADQRIALTSARALQELAVGLWQSSLANFNTMVDVVEEAQSARLAATVVAIISGVFSTLPGSLPCLERLESVLERLVSDDRDRLALLELRLSVLPWRGRWDEARATFGELCRLSEQLGSLHWTLLRTGLLGTQDAMLRGDRAGAEALFEQVLGDLAANPAAAHLLGVLYHSWRARTRWLFGDFQGLRADHEQIVGLQLGRAIHPYTAAAQPLTSALLALAEARYEEAHAALDQMLALQERLRYTTISGDARVLLAHLHLQRDQPDAALAALTPALAEALAANAPGYLMWQGPIVVPLLRLAVAQGLHAPFATRVLELLDALSSSAPLAEAAMAVAPPAAPLQEHGEVLTEREIEVLRVMATGVSNTEIATRLIISPHTAKRHVSNVLAKLGATTRTEAVARGRERGLL